MGKEKYSVTVGKQINCIVCEFCAHVKVDDVRSLYTVRERESGNELVTY